MSEIPILGHVIYAQIISMDPSKVDVVLQWDFLKLL